MLLQKNFSFLIDMCLSVCERTEELKADLELHERVTYVLDWYERRLR